MYPGRRGFVLRIVYGRLGMGKNVVDRVRARASRAFSRRGTGHKFISDSLETRVSPCAALTGSTLQESATIFR